MKTVLLFLLLVFTLNLYSQVHVRGYYRSNGTYVQPHERTAPNSTITDNYSYPGNYNPNKVYNNSSSNTTYNNSNSNSTATEEWVNGYYRSNGTYVSGYYRTKVKSNNTNNSINSSSNTTYNNSNSNSTATEEWVNGYYNSNGTYVSGYYRTKVKSNDTNNSIDSSNKKYVIASQVNLRTSSEITNNVIMKLNYADEIKSLYRIGNWEKVIVKQYNSYTYNYDTYVGYINSNYLSNYSPSTSSNYSTTNSNYSETKLKKYKVISEKAYFYTTPSTYDKKSAYLVYGEIIQAIGESQYFIYIEFVNTSGIKTIGWILKKDLLLN